jgi:hypothetical protein
MSINEPKHDPVAQPYFSVAGDLVVNVLALHMLVQQQRPETATFNGTLHVSVDAGTGVVVVGLVQEDGRAIVVERIVADPRQPALFGSSALPIALKDSRMH